MRRSKNEQKRREWFEHPHEFGSRPPCSARPWRCCAWRPRAQGVRGEDGRRGVPQDPQGEVRGQLTYHDKRVESGGLRSAECAQALEVVNKQFERELERLFEEERQREAKPGDWNTPSLEEKEEDRLEDEQQAREEAERAR